MKLLLFLSLIVGVLTSCSAPRLFQQGVRKIDKAITKDPSLKLPSDTIRIFKTDTIPGIDGKDSIIIQKETITIPCDFNIEEVQETILNNSRRNLRHIRKIYGDSLRHDEKMYKLEIKRLKDSLVQANRHYRLEVKKIKSDNSTEVKIIKEETKQKKGSWFQRQMGKIWWLLLIIGIAVGFYLRGLLPTITNPFKRNSS